MRAVRHVSRNPGQVIEVHQANGLRMGKIDFGGINREACLEYLPEAVIGDFVMVHVGFAIRQGGRS